MSAELYTASWGALWRAQQADTLGVEPVRISVGVPKFWPGAERFPAIPELTPYGVFGRGLSGEEYDAAYLARLNGIGPERIEALLVETYLAAGRALALACFEPQRRDCHRGLAARWIEEHLRIPCPELALEPTQLSLDDV